MEERRRTARLNARLGYRVACSGLDAGSRSAPDYNFAVRSLDVSASGACLVTSGRLREGVRFQIQVVTPDGRRSSRMTAVVRWSTTVESRGRTAHVAGFEFEQPVPALGPLPPRAAARPQDPQRRHRRFRPRIVALECAPYDFKRSLGLKTNVALHVHDLSQSGARIVSNRKLDKGDRLDLVLTFRYPPTTATLRGEVRWCRRDTMSLEPRWFAGVIFKTVDTASHRALRDAEELYPQA